MRFALSAMIGLLAASRGELSVSYRNLVFHGPVSTLTVLPGETVTFATEGSPVLAGVVANGAGKWRWTAPQRTGIYPLEFVSADLHDSLTIQAFVLVPFHKLRREHLNGYRIGSYPSRPLRGLDIYRPPRGFIEVTRANENTLVSPHFRLKQFICKQGGSYPKYVVLNEGLLQKLEQLLALANAAGYEATTFHVMSGYRTPAYNRALGNVPYSRHTWGAAADIFIDENNDGQMDDLNGDGRSDLADARVLGRLFDSATEGGMGEYRPTAAHGPFVHVDVRDRKARW